MRITQVDRPPPDVRELLAAHRAWAAEHSPPEDVHALDAAALDDPLLTLFAASADDAALLGVGGLRRLDERHGELKAMHTVAGGRGRGTGRALLAHLLGVAVERGYDRVSLETGTMAAFTPARALYASAGFLPCPPFGGYGVSPHSVCMTRLVRVDADAG